MQFHLSTAYACCLISLTNLGPRTAERRLWRRSRQQLGPFFLVLFARRWNRTGDIRGRGSVAKEMKGVCKSPKSEIDLSHDFDSLMPLTDNDVEECARTLEKSVAYREMTPEQVRVRESKEIGPTTLCLSLSHTYPPVSQSVG